MLWLAVATGGALGALARWGISFMFSPVAGFPIGTFLCNIGGSFALGWLTRKSAQKQWPQWAVQGIGAGFLGAFTTMSAFGLEAWELMLEQQWGTAAGYAIASALFGPIAAYAGMRSSRLLLRDGS